MNSRTYARHNTRGSRTYSAHHAHADLRKAAIRLDQRGRRFKPADLEAVWSSGDDGRSWRLLFVSMSGANVTKSGLLGELHRFFAWTEPEPDTLPTLIREWVEAHRPLVTEPA